LSKVKKIVFWFLSVNIFAIIIFIRPFLKIRINVLDTSRIGHLLDESLNYLIYKKKNSNIDIWISLYPICNQYLYKQIKRKINVFEGNSALILIRVYNLLKFFNLKNFIINKFNYRSFKHWKNISKKIKLIKIDNKIEKEIKKILFKNKIILKKKIVCINIRDSFFLKKTFPNKDWKYHDFRNSNIKNYKLAINYLLNKGYQVFRVGENNDNFDIKNKNYINLYDYNFEKSLIDLYLVKNSKFVLCNNTGWECLAAYFNKEILMFDAISMANTHFGYPYKIIFKHIYYKKKIKLKLSEIIDKNYHFLMNVDDFKKNKLSVKDNNSKEILILVKQHLNKKYKNKKRFNLLQNQIKKNIIRSIKKYNKNGIENLKYNHEKINWEFGENFLINYF
jgi:putative glycosyltransferase (TIGR04372 family)